MIAIATADADTLAEITVAKESLEYLFGAYPGHKWTVGVRGGVIIVKALNVSSIWCYVVPFSQVKHDAAVFKRKVIHAGGEVLERARLERGASTGQVVDKVDGIANYTGLGQF